MNHQSLKGTWAKSLQEKNQKKVNENAKNAALEERKVTLKTMNQTRQTNSEGYCLPPPPLPTKEKKY